MSIAIIFNHKDPKPWAEALRQKLPDVEIEIYPEIKNKEKITFALCWKPEKDVLAQFPNLRVAQSVGASADNTLQTQQLNDNIVVTRVVDEQLSIDMYEFLLAGILGYMKNFPTYAADEKNEVWQPKPYKSIANTILCILGLGEIGAFVAEKFSALGFEVKGWSKSEKKRNNIACFYGENGLAEAINGSDVLLNLLPLTPETEDILNLKNLQLLNRNGFLMNVGRGNHLVEADLLHLLETEHLSGALLDVFRVEPLPQTHPFWRHERISITPHIASITNVATASDVVVENYRRFQRQETLLNVVSVQKGY